YIGTDVTGTRPLGNTTGIEVVGPNAGIEPMGTTAVIGGTAAGARNLISGNGFGLTLWAREVVVQGNYIGTDLTGTQPLPNGVGIDFNSGIGTLIGGTAAAERNIVSGNVS